MENRIKTSVRPLATVTLAIAGGIAALLVTAVMLREGGAGERAALAVAGVIAIAGVQRFAGVRIAARHLHAVASPLAFAAFAALLLYPVFARAHSGAPRLSPRAQLRGIGSAFQQYARDHDASQPLPDTLSGMKAQLQPYLARPTFWRYDDTQQFLIDPAILGKPMAVFNGYANSVLAFAPRSTVWSDGTTRRLTLFVSGRAEYVPEGRFRDLRTETMFRARRYERTQARLGALATAAEAENAR